MLEGNEVEKKFDGEAGKIFVDVDDKGGVEFGIKYDKDFGQFGKSHVDIGHKVGLLDLISAYVAKTGNKIDDAALGVVKKLLNLE